ncbi:MAG TPA: DEAD/DEAH box helicase [Xanthobacteraceae bacterium]|nr:DEAD/DEAH box helicase [Xanthobacteraceae bacterium]
MLDRPPSPQGWRTTDEDEIALRRWRGSTDILAIEALEAEHPIFGTFRARSGTGGSYDVEIRSLDAFANSCGCIDHRVNGLGTCKHVEGVLAAIRRTHAKVIRAAETGGSSRVEIFIDRRDTAARLAVTWPAGRRAHVQAVHGWLDPFLAPDGTLGQDRAAAEALLAAWQSAPKGIRQAVRMSRHIAAWVERLARQHARVEARAAFMAEVDAGRADLDLLKHKLLPYQVDGMLHLAFGERALLADEMGLGKTVQAIAACELLARRKDVDRVLVVCPASLKAEWEEQIARFTERRARSVFGPRPQRVAAYKDPAFFTIVNYEQILVDAEDINGILAPDIVILDEAQRIKNWQTKTARRVKSLRSPYAFVLTGTPIENRIDELYSIVQYLDPELMGPLFRFNRDFYQLDERGRAVDYRNLEELRRRVGAIMLRRRKADVENELPGRTVKTYFVPMVDEQAKRYEDYRVPAARLIHQSQRRPLTPAEFERLMMLLNCMRMLCDTPAILDPSCRISPKLEELEGILGDLFEEPDRKVIIFSEWERMLELVRELAAEMGIETAWHTGSVPQQRRRAEIQRFKNDPSCRIFLSTDSGSVGLNLQVASAVVNVDLPWNPAKLEQRIARAWRKNQTRSVTVVNLVCESSIEHGILHLLGQKQALAEGILDGQGDISKLKLPSGRAAMIERMQAMMQAAEQAAPRIVTADEAIAEELRKRHGERALLIEARRGADGRLRVLAVLDLDADGLAAEARRVAERKDDAVPAIEIIDRATWLAIRRLETTGMLKLAEGSIRILHRAAELVGEQGASDQAARAADLQREAERSLRMAKVLATGGFAEEAPMLIAKTLGCLGAAKLAALGELPPGDTTATPQQLRDLVDRGALPARTATTLAGLWPAAGAPSGGELAELIGAAERAIAEYLEGETRGVSAAA